MIRAAMGGEAFCWPCRKFCSPGKSDHIMMAMETEITKDGIFYKEVEGTPKEKCRTGRRVMFI